MSAVFNALGLLLLGPWSLVFFVGQLALERWFNRRRRPPFDAGELDISRGYEDPGEDWLRG